MNAKRLSRLFLITALLIVVVVALQVFVLPASTKETSKPIIGMGDLHRYEAENEYKPYVGMGDLRRFEFMQEKQAAK